MEKQALQHIYRLRTEQKHGIKNTSSQNEGSTVHFIVGMRPAERKWILMMASALNHKTETVFQLKFWHACGFWPTKPPPQKSLPMQLSITPTDTESLPLPSSPWPFETGTKKKQCALHFVMLQLLTVKMPRRIINTTWQLFTSPKWGWKYSKVILHDQVRAVSIRDLTTTQCYTSIPSTMAVEV